MWQGFWDFVFVVASTLLAILFGAAAGNLARGVPLAADGTFSMAFFTDFTTRGYVGLLDWYTISIAVFAAVVLAAHGATYLTLKTQGAVHDRSVRYSRVLWPAAAVLLLVISMESAVVRPDLLEHAARNPFWWLGLLLICAAAATLISGLVAQREMRARIKGVTFALMIATTLHSIAVGNLLPAWVKVVSVDINPATVVKLSDRGSIQTVGLVTDVEPFLRVLVSEVEALAK